MLLGDFQTNDSMARYSAFLGRRVEVQYRAGDILLPASGTFVADSGRSIFLEQSFEQRGQARHFRWEIPYGYIVRIEEKQPDLPQGANVAAGISTAGQAEAGTKAEEKGSSAAATNAGGAPGILPLQNRPKTA